MSSTAVPSGASTVASPATKSSASATWANRKVSTRRPTRPCAATKAAARSTPNETASGSNSPSPSSARFAMTAAPRDARSPSMWPPWLASSRTRDCNRPSPASSSARASWWRAIVDDGAGGSAGGGGSAGESEPSCTSAHRGHIQSSRRQAGSGLGSSGLGYAVACGHGPRSSARTRPSARQPRQRVRLRATNAFAARTGPPAPRSPTRPAPAGPAASGRPPAPGPNDRRSPGPRAPACRTAP